MLQLATQSVGNRFYPIPIEEAFIFTAQIENRHDDQHYIIRAVGDQDFVHNVKKLVNLLLHSSRLIMVGQYLAHLNQLSNK